MMGGNRDKWTPILANFAEVAPMNIACDGCHAHAPTGVGYITGKSIPQEDVHGSGINSVASCS